MNARATILSLFSLMLIVGFSACTKKEYLDRDIENPNRAYVVSLPSNSWIRESPSLIRFDIPLRDLTEYYLLQGGVSVAVSFDDESSYDVLPSTFSAIAYSVNYGIGEISIFAEDPLADESVTVSAPQGKVFAKIILSTTDYFNYTGFFNSPSSEFDFKTLDLKSGK